jgi:hypothetical protein
MSTPEKFLPVLGNPDIEEKLNASDYEGGMSDTSFRSNGQDVNDPPLPKYPGHDAPDGGVAAWLVVLGAWCTSVCSFGWLNSMWLQHHILLGAHRLSSLH